LRGVEYADLKIGDAVTFVVVDGEKRAVGGQCGARLVRKKRPESLRGVFCLMFGDNGTQ